MNSKRNRNNRLMNFSHLAEQVGRIVVQETVCRHQAPRAVGDDEFDGGRRVTRSTADELGETTTSCLTTTCIATVAQRR